MHNCHSCIYISVSQTKYCFVSFCNKCINIGSIMMLFVHSSSKIMSNCFISCYKIIISSVCIIVVYIFIISVLPKYISQIESRICARARDAAARAANGRPHVHVHPPGSTWARGGDVRRRATTHCACAAYFPWTAGMYIRQTLLDGTPEGISIMIVTGIWIKVYIANAQKV